MTSTEEVTGHAPGTRRHEVVVGIDESPASVAALHWAVDHASASGLPLRLVHAWQLSAAATAATAAVASGGGQYLEAAAADARARATRWVLDTLGGDAADVRWVLEVHEAAAGALLVARGHEAELLVVGTHEHTGLRRVLAGSVSHYVLSHADVAVVAVPAPAAVPAARDGRDALLSAPLL